jgi:D-alanyl-D-alanine carboxypeptidase
MNKLIINISTIFIIILAGCVHNTPNTILQTTITLPVETIKSNGTILKQSFSKDEETILEEELENIFNATQIKGISTSVGIPGTGVWSSSRGTTGNSSKEKITPDLKFCAGSIGKIFTAVVILNLVEEGSLKLESTVEKWFPEISWADQVTIDHLLTHTSGIASFDNMEEYENHKYLYYNSEELLSYINQKKLLFNPGKHFAYSNTGYLMLGIIIERLTGKSYKEVVDQYIIDRIGLQNTEVIMPETINNLIVKGHHEGKVLNKTEYSDVPFAAGSIAATPSDLILFLHALMSGKILSQAGLQIMFSDMNLMTDTQNTHYGKGIVTALTPVGKIIGHRGGIKGFGASLYYHPEKNIFICVMMNDDAKSPDPAVFSFLEIMMKL